MWEISKTVHRVGKLSPHKNTLLGIALGPRNCSTEKADVGAGRGYENLQIMGLQSDHLLCSCPRPDQFNKFVSNDCLRSFSYLQILPDSGNSFVSIMSSKVFEALGYGKDDLVGLGKKVVVKGAGGKCLEILGKMRVGLPLYLGGRKIIKFCPVIIKGLEGAEIILSPGALASLGANHIYEQENINFTRIQLRVKLETPVVVAKWLEKRRSANFVANQDGKQRKKAHQCLIDGFISTQVGFEGKRPSNLSKLSQLRQQLEALQIKDRQGKLGQFQLKELEPEVQDDKSECGGECLFHSQVIQTDKYYQGDCRFRDSRNQSSINQMVEDCDATLEALLSEDDDIHDSTDRKKKEKKKKKRKKDSATNSTRTEVVAAGKWHRPRGTQVRVCPNPGCAWKDDLSKVGEKVRNLIENKHKQCVLGVTSEENWGVMGKQTISLNPQASTKIRLRVKKSELLEGRDVLIELSEEIKKKHNIKMYDTVDLSLIHI